MNTADVAKIMGITPAHLYNWLATHKRLAPPKGKMNKYMWTDGEIERVRNLMNPNVTFPMPPITPSVPVPPRPSVNETRLRWIRLSNYIMTCAVSGPDNSDIEIQILNEIIDNASLLLAAKP